MSAKQCPCCKRAFREAAPPANGKGKGTPFGKLLERAADKAGLTNTEIARRLDTNVSRTAQIFHAENLTERTLKETAAVLGYDVEVRLVRRRR